MQYAVVTSNVCWHQAGCFRCPVDYVFLQVQAPSAVDVGNDQEQAKPLDLPSSDPNVFHPDDVLEDAMLRT